MAAHAFDVSADLWPEVRFSDSRAEPFVFPENGQNFVTARDWRVRQCTSDRVGHLALVFWISEAEQEADDNRVGTARLCQLDNATDFLGLEFQYNSFGSNAFGNTNHVGSVHQRRRVMFREVLEIGAVLAPQPEQIFETRRSHKQHPSTSSLEQGVGGHRCAVHE
jgi:hypothetical protein